jgi:hypothetical protein
MRKLPLLLVLLSLTSFAQDINNAKDVIVAMQTKYSGKWYTNLVFDQTAYTYKDGCVKNVETWHEYLSCPGKLHIRKGAIESGDGMIFRNDSLYEFQESVMTLSIKKYHDLLFWGFDVYFLDKEKVFNKAGEMNYDLNKMYETTWNGKAVYVIGADKGEEKYNQAWIDKEGLYLVRVIKKDGNSIKDIEFNNYQKIAGNWVATEIIFKIDQKIYMKEVYYNISFPLVTDPKVFEVSNFIHASW